MVASCVNAIAADPKFLAAAQMQNTCNMPNNSGDAGEVQGSTASNAAACAAYGYGYFGNAVGSNMRLVPYMRRDPRLVLWYEPQESTTAEMEKSRGVDDSSGARINTDKVEKTPFDPCIEWSAPCKLEIPEEIPPARLPVPLSHDDAEVFPDAGVVMSPDSPTHAQVSSGTAPCVWVVLQPTWVPPVRLKVPERKWDDTVIVSPEAKLVELRHAGTRDALKNNVSGADDDVGAEVDGNDDDACDELFFALPPPSPDLEPDEDAMIPFELVPKVHPVSGLVAPMATTTASATDPVKQHSIDSLDSIVGEELSHLIETATEKVEDSSLLIEEDVMASKLESFIAQHNLDEGARRALRRLHFDEADAVMRKVRPYIRNHPNKNALVMRHLAKVQMKCGRRFFGETTVKERALSGFSKETEKVQELLGVSAEDDDGGLVLIEDVTQAPTDDPQTDLGAASSSFASGGAASTDDAADSQKRNVADIVTENLAIIKRQKREIEEHNMPGDAAGYAFQCGDDGFVSAEED